MISMFISSKSCSDMQSWKNAAIEKRKTKKQNRNQYLVFSSALAPSPVQHHNSGFTPLLVGMINRCHYKCVAYRQTLCYCFEKWKLNATPTEGVWELPWPNEGDNFQPNYKRVTSFFFFFFFKQETKERKLINFKRAESHRCENQFEF